jgi:hypothetical protein
MEMSTNTLIRMGGSSTTRTAILDVAATRTSSVAPARALGDSITHRSKVPGDPLLGFGLARAFRVSASQLTAKKQCAAAVTRGDLVAN